MVEFCLARRPCRNYTPHGTVVAPCCDDKSILLEGARHVTARSGLLASGSSCGFASERFGSDSADFQRVSRESCESLADSI